MIEPSLETETEHARGVARRTHPPFQPARALGNPHAMTLALVIPRRLGLLAHSEHREVVVDTAGARVALSCRWVGSGSSPTLVLVHGFTGSIRSSYMVGCARKAVERGWNVIRMNCRGSGGTEHLGRPLGHVGLTADLDRVLRELATDARVDGLYLAGFSMGANLVLKLAGEWGSEPPVPLRAVIGVSPAIDVARCARECDDRPALRIYRRNFVRLLRQMLRRHNAHFGIDSDAAAIRRLRTIRAFDEFYTVPTWGFGSVDEYWAAASAIPTLEQIAVPTLVLASRDDVLVPFESLEPLRGSAREGLWFVETDAGGHCAFIAGSRSARADDDRFWAENRLLDFVASIARRARGLAPIAT